MSLDNLSDPQLQALISHYGLPLSPPQTYTRNFAMLTPQHYSSLLPSTMMFPQQMMMNPQRTKPAPNIVFNQNPQPYEIPLGGMGQNARIQQVQQQAQQQPIAQSQQAVTPAQPPVNPTGFK